MLTFDAHLKFTGFSFDAAFTAGNELVVLFGPSGAGKSLTLNILAGLNRPDSGFIKAGERVFFSAADKINLPPQQRRVGYVFQDYALFPHLTVAGNIAFGLAGADKKATKAKVESMLELMRLERLGDSYPHQISGGQKQRVALARALVIEPSMLLLDEPFSALDSAVRERLRMDLLKIKREFAVPILFVTHDLEEAYMVADRVVVFNQGKVLQVGTRDEVFYRPGGRTVARFVGAKNIFAGEVVSADTEGCRISAGDFEVVAPPQPVTIGQAVEFCIRPEEIMVVRPDRELNEKMEQNVLCGKIIDVLRRGPTYQLKFALEGRSNGETGFIFTIRLPAHAYERLGLERGRQIKVSLKKPSVHLLPKEA